MSRPTVQRALGGVLALALTAGCGGSSNTLTGSLDEIASLKFDNAAVRAGSTALVIEYQRFPGGGGTDIPFKLVVNPVGLTLTKDLPINLAEVLPDGSLRATATRAVGQDPRRVLPPIMRGELDLDSNIGQGGTATGHFHLLFAEGGEIGEGRTVEGTYSAPVADVRPGGEP